MTACKRWRVDPHTHPLSGPPMGQGQAQCGIEPRAGGTKGTYLIASSTARRVPFSRVYPVSCRRLHAAAGRVDEKRRTDVMSSSAPSSGIIELQQARGAPLPTAATALPPVLVSRAGGLNSPSPQKPRPSVTSVPSPRRGTPGCYLVPGSFPAPPSTEPTLPPRLRKVPPETWALPLLPRPPPWSLATHHLPDGAGASQADDTDAWELGRGAGESWHA